MAHHTKKSKKRNIKGRKNPQFAESIVLMYSDALTTIDELMEKKGTREFDPVRGRDVVRYDEMPDGVTAIDSLGGNTVFTDVRLFRHIERIQRALEEFGDEFRTEEGASVFDLGVDRKNRTWGNQIAVLALAYLAIAVGLAEWTEPRSEWSKHKDGNPRIRFTKQETPKEIYESIKSDPERITTPGCELPTEGANGTNPTSLA